MGNKSYISCEPCRKDINHHAVQYMAATVAYTRHSTLANRRVTVKMVYDSSLLRHAQHEQPFERHQGKTRDGTWSRLDGPSLNLKFACTPIADSC